MIKRIILTLLVASLLFVALTFVWPIHRVIGGPAEYGSPLVFHAKGRTDVPPFNRNCVDWFRLGNFFVDYLVFLLPTYGAVMLFTSRKKLG